MNIKIHMKAMKQGCFSILESTIIFYGLQKILDA
jgi:hypothetical protein